jgi:hypothetical protein
MADLGAIGSSGTVGSEGGGGTPSGGVSAIGLAQIVSLQVGSAMSTNPVSYTTVPAAITFVVPVSRMIQS